MALRMLVLVAYAFRLSVRHHRVSTRSRFEAAPLADAGDRAA